MSGFISRLPDNQIDKINCRECARDTNHDVCAESIIEEDNDNYWSTSYQIVRCRGCESLAFRVEHYDAGEEYSATLALYPPRAEGRRAISDTDLSLIDTRISAIYRETHAALSSGMRTLAGIGLRAMLESICNSKNIDGKNLAEKINALSAAKIISLSGKDILHSIRTLGNNAAHEATPHTESQISLAMDVLEGVLRELYIFPHRAKAEFSDLNITKKI